MRWWTFFLIWTAILTLLAILIFLVGSFLFGQNWSLNEIPFAWVVFLVLCLLCWAGAATKQPQQQEQQQQQEQPQALAPAESAIVDRHRTELIPELAAPEPANEMSTSNFHPNLRITISLPTYEDAVTHQESSALSESQMLLPSYDEAEVLASDGVKSSVRNSQP